MGERKFKEESKGGNSGSPQGSKEHHACWDTKPPKGKKTGASGSKDVKVESLSRRGIEKREFRRIGN